MPPSRVALFSGRMLFIRLLLLGAFFILAARLIFLQIYQDSFLDKQVISRSHSEYSLLANRGKILDRNNNVLALDVRSFSVGIDLKNFKGNILNIESLEEILGVKKETISGLIKNKKTGKIRKGKDLMNPWLHELKNKGFHVPNYQMPHMGA